MIDKALQIAFQAHEGQVDKAGKPYIYHPLRVMFACKGNPQAQMAAILHDVVEDCPEWSIERIEACGFPPDVIEALDLLTHKPGEDCEAYIERIKAHPIAREVKLADLADNMNLKRINNPGPRDLDRLANYKAAKTILLA